MNELETFMRGMDGMWEVVSINKDGDRVRITYKSMSVPGLTWSHLPVGEMTVKVGMIGRIGFIEVKQS